MEPENVIEVNNITKKFKVYVDKGRTLKELALFSKRRKYEEREVLKGISFKVKRGEAIGLIGHNGCGKSTTLKLLTKIMYPDTGTIEMRGRVSSLIELGAGFHPDMSGRQNIYTNAAIFGLTRREIDERVDDIIAFSELGEFIDNPVRTYSSGMYMRLAFSVAINVDADILLIDEILAVGDANFQSKCFSKLREIKSQGTTIVIVSHSLGQIEQICEKSIWIHEGKVNAEGIPRDVHPQYLDFMGQKRQDEIDKEKERQGKKEVSSKAEESNTYTEEKELEIEKCETLKENEGKRWGTGEIRISDVYAMNQEGKESTVYKTGEYLTLVIKYIVNKPVENAIFGIGFFRDDGVNCYGSNTMIEKISNINITQDGKTQVIFKQMNLLAGIYSLDIAIQKNQGESVDYYKNALKIEMYSLIEDIGVIRLDHDWIIE